MCSGKDQRSIDYRSVMATDLPLTSVSKIEIINCFLVKV